MALLNADFHTQDGSHASIVRPVRTAPEARPIRGRAADAALGWRNRSVSHPDFPRPFTRRL